MVMSCNFQKPLTPKQISMDKSMKEEKWVILTVPLTRQVKASVTVSPSIPYHRYLTAWHGNSFRSFQFD